MKRAVESLVLLAGTTLCVGSAFAEGVEVYRDSELVQVMNVLPCNAGEACQQKLSISGTLTNQSSFSSYEALNNWLTQLEIDADALDATWEAPLESDVVVKVNGVPVSTQKAKRACRTRRDCKHKKLDKPTETSNAIWGAYYSNAVVTLEFVNDVGPIDSADFTLNVKSYANGVLIGSQSSAWFTGDGDGSTIAR